MQVIHTITKRDVKVCPLRFTGSILLSFIIVVLSIILHCDAYGSQNHVIIDAAIVLDSTGGTQKPAPLTLRVQAAKLFIPLLNEDDRAAIIGFSDKATLLARLTNVDNVINTNSLLRALDMISSAGVHTNLYEALERASDVLIKSDLPGRTKVIILMTDKTMDTGDAKRDKALEVNLTEVLLKKLKGAGITLYTISFNKHKDSNLLDVISKATGGFYSLAETTDDLQKIYSSIFEALGNTGARSTKTVPFAENGFSVDSSVEEITIVVKKASQNTKIYLRSPNGDNYSSDTVKDNAKNNKRDNTHIGIKWYATSKFEMITLNNPLTGNWKILYNPEANNKVYVITNMELQSSLDNTVLRGKPLLVKAWLKQNNDILQKDVIGDNVDVIAEITGPDEANIVVHLAGKGLGQDDAMIYSGSFTPELPGVYKMRIAAKGKTFDREKSTTFMVTEQKASLEAPANDTTKTGAKTGDTGTTAQNANNNVNPNVNPNADINSTGLQSKPANDKLSVKSVVLKVVIMNIITIVIVVVCIKLWFARRGRKDDQD